MNHEELYKKLTKLAYQKSKPFCYHCYGEAPAGTCSQCMSDDLMRLTNSGCEYGIDWVIQEILTEKLNPVDLEKSFSEMIEDVYGSTVNIAWGDFSTVDVLKEQDPIAWRCALAEYISNEESDGTIVSFDNGSSYYSVSDVEEFIEAEI